MAHEVGHNTGMLHDFDDQTGNDRYDSQGNSCTNIGGVMDYSLPMTRDKHYKTFLIFNDTGRIS
jgi:hypothetical protein